MPYLSSNRARDPRLRRVIPALLVCWLLSGIASSAFVGAYAVQAPVADSLASASKAYGLNDFSTADAYCTSVISVLLAKPSLDPMQQGQLLEAYALRARARYAMRQLDSMKEDLKALLALKPSYDLGAVNPNVDTAFKTLRAELYGKLSLQITPAGAEVKVDGVIVDLSKSPIDLAAGPHTVSVVKPGYQEVSETITIRGNAPPLEFTRNLDRIFSTLMFLTLPADVEVWINDVLAGTTRTGTLPSDWAEAARDDLNAMGSLASSVGFLLVENVSSGDKNVEYRKSCFKTEPRTKMAVGVPKPDNFFVKPVVKLASTGAPITVKGPDGRVVIDGEDVGTVPYTGVLCPKAAPITVEFRSDRGHYSERVTPEAGRPILITAEPKPALAILTAVGLPDGFRSDLRRDLENALSSSSAVSVFAPAQDLVQRELVREHLDPDWLSFDAAGRPLPPALNVKETDRRTLSASLSSRLGAQGVAQITVPSKQSPWNVLVTILAAGGAQPDTVALNIDDKASVNQLVARLNTTPPLMRVSAGIQVADVLNAGGAVVVKQIWRDSVTAPTLQKGDIIRAVDGNKIADGSAFLRFVSTRKAGDRLRLDVASRDGAVQTVELPVLALPEVIGLYDQSLLPNKLVLEFREATIKYSGRTEEYVARMNLAVALMRVGALAEAVDHLSKVRLADGPGVSAGTVQFLFGVCYDGLGRPTEAAAAFRMAMASSDALLTSDGPEIKPLAEEKLADLQRRIR